MIRARARAVLWLALLALVATACSGGGDDDTATEEAAATEAGDGDATEEAGTDTADAAADDEAADDGAGAEVPDNPAEGVTADSIVLGWMGDVTGPTASSQGFNLRGAEAAVEYYNAQGGVLGRQIELVALDDQFSAETALTNYRRLVDDDTALALIGMGGGHISEALMPDVEADGIPLIGPPQTIDVQLENPYVFNNIAHYSDQADVAVEYMIREHGDAADLRVAVVHLELPSGEEWNTYVQRRLEERGGTHIGAITLNTSSPDYAGAAVTLRQMVDNDGVNFIALSGAPSNAVGMLYEMESLGIQVPSIGIHGITGTTVFEEGPPGMLDLVHGIHSFVPPTSECDLCATIREFVGEDDGLDEINFSHGWLDVWIAIQAIERAAETGELSRESLTEALRGEFDTGGLSCTVDWSTSNHSPCAAPFEWDGERVDTLGSFEEWSEVLQGEYGVG